MNYMVQGLFHRVIAQSGPLISNSSPMQVADFFCICLLHLSITKCQNKNPSYHAKDTLSFLEIVQMQVMGKRAKLYGRTYAESLGCLKSDTTEEVENQSFKNFISMQQRRIKL